MIDDPHFGFVLAAYAIGFFIVAGMIFAILRDYFALRRALALFPGRGETDVKRETSR
jgi:heme exporter protein D